MALLIPWADAHRHKSAQMLYLISSLQHPSLSSPFSVASSTHARTSVYRLVLVDNCLVVSTDSIAQIALSLRDKIVLIASSVKVDCTVSLNCSGNAMYLSSKVKVISYIYSQKRKSSPRHSEYVSRFEYCKMFQNCIDETGQLVVAELRYLLKLPYNYCCCNFFLAYSSNTKNL